MEENDILDIINSNSIPELLHKIGKFHPDGFNIEKIDKRKNKRT